MDKLQKWFKPKVKEINKRSIFNSFRKYNFDDKEIKKIKEENKKADNNQNLNQIVNEIIDKTEEELVLDEFREILYGLANRQSKTIEQDKPAVIFIQKLYSLIESEQAVVLDRAVFSDYRPANFIGYEDDEFYCLNSDLAHRAVYQLCKSQGESFTIKKNELIKALAYEGLLDSDKGKNVKSVNVCGKGSMKLLCIIKEKANKIAASAE